MPLFPPVECSPLASGAQAGFQLSWFLLLGSLIQSTTYIAIHNSPGLTFWLCATETNPKYFKPKENLLAGYWGLQKSEKVTRARASLAPGVNQGFNSGASWSLGPEGCNGFDLCLYPLPSFHSLRIYHPWSGV